MELKELIELMEEIQEEQRNNPGLAVFAGNLFKKHLKFLERLNRMRFVDSYDAISILNQVIREIKKAERNKKHKGAFRETNLDWAYARKAAFMHHITGRVDYDTWKKVCSGFKAAGLW
ncbi:MULTISPECIES: hypothetical protein [unclassified Delftia]|uniref:hypothetical protein n=1 Tax=unclassified Delftia TaxID=2613839 RepID=UPI0018FFD343|nr:MULTISPECIES: hypothetical protein [unclassified Delftia]MBK0114497.1 hypothetical protein [Delftia sp. S65]MBK0116568.1 hypothetical protein [Delftia sp. S67]MBK0131792.1 hypothetical protein [Delftia sp. S66]